MTEQADGPPRGRPNARTTIGADTFALATPAGRKPGTAGHAQALRFVAERFGALGLLPYAAEGYRHRYSASASWPLGGEAMTNLVGVVPGADRDLPPVVIGAHYDSVIESWSADDNAAAVAVLLEVARRLVADPVSRDVLVCAFDCEEPPHFLGPDMGSIRLVEDVLDEVHAAVVMDLVGHPIELPGVDPRLTVVTGIESHPGFADLLDGVELPVIAVRNDRVGDMSDHHAFRMAGVPFLFVSSGEWRDYHTAGDRPELLDYAKLELVADAVEHMVRFAAARELGASRLWDIEDVEWATLRAHLGPLLPMLPGNLSRIVPALRSTLQR